MALKKEKVRFLRQILEIREIAVFRDFESLKRMCPRNEPFAFFSPTDRTSVVDLTYLLSVVSVRPS